MAYGVKGDDDRAIVDFTKAIELKPNYADAYYSRGVAYKNKNNPDRATADFHKAIALKPDYASTYNNHWPEWLPLKEVLEESRSDQAIAGDLGKNITLSPQNAPGNVSSFNLPKEITAMPTTLQA